MLYCLNGAHKNKRTVILGTFAVHYHSDTDSCPYSPSRGGTVCSIRKFDGPHFR